MRTFVFISHIPDFLLQPTRQFNESTAHLGAAAHAKAASRDPRYERLRRVLVEHSSGLMLVMHLETRGYALALYASEEEALQACRATIIPKPPAPHAGTPSKSSTPAPAPASRDSQCSDKLDALDGSSHGDDDRASASSPAACAPLRLRIVERERPAAPEAVYTPTITIEGEEVEKSSLALTRGLELAYRGRVVPRWCACTQQGEDCIFGTACHRIHRRVHQRTLRKRPRLDWLEVHGKHTSDTNTNSSASNNRNDTAEDGGCGEALTARLLRSRPDYEAALFDPDNAPGDGEGRVGEGRKKDAAVGNSEHANSRAIATTRMKSDADGDMLSRHVPHNMGAVPDDLRLCPSVYIPITTLELHTLLHIPTQTAHHTTRELRRGLAARVRERCKQGELTRPFFVRLSCPGGAPWDWSLYDDEDIDDTTRRRCGRNDCSENEDSDSDCDSDDGGDDERANFNERGGAPRDEVPRSVQVGQSGAEQQHQSTTRSHRQGQRSGWARLRRRCPPPARGTPTPLERDVFIQRVLIAMNELNRFTHLSTALRALACSPRVRQAVLAEQEQQQKQQQKQEARVANTTPQKDSLAALLKHTRANTTPTATEQTGGERVAQDNPRDRAGEHGCVVAQRRNDGACQDLERCGTAAATSWYLCIHPWIPLASPACEVSVFADDGGRRVRAVVQRYGQQPILTPAALPLPMRQVEWAFTDAAARLCRAVAQHREGVTNTRLSHSLARTAWCARLALVAPANRNTSIPDRSSSSSDRDISHTSRNAICHNDNDSEKHKVVVLSMRDYVTALETCPMHAQVTMTSQSDAAARSVQESVSRVPAIVWNMQRHSHVPLLEQDVLERLCMPVG